MASNQGEIQSSDASYGPSNFVGFGGRTLAHVGWYLGILTPGSGLLSTVTVTFRWNDGVANRVFTSAGLSLLTTGFITGSNTLYAAENQQITYEVNMSSLLGSPAFVFRYQFSICDMD